MPFPPNIREEALVACGRHCCLCHRFVGTKIECHHIDPEADGGDDSLANCIPLCFDCHAEVQHYNPQHPKGTRFRSSELRAHRDRWLDRVSRTTPAIFDDERRSVDREVFNRIRSEIPEIFVREYLKEHCWGQPINSDTLDKIYAIDRFLQRLDSEFLDPTCEGYRASFLQAFRRFWNNEDFIQISPLDHNPKMYRIPKAWTRSGDPEVRKQFYDCMNNLNRLSTEAFEEYEAMIREIRRLLIIT
jgi:hypothetical protein